MARQPRFLIEDQDTCYHLIGRLAGPRDWCPLQDPEVAKIFFELFFKFLSVYFCDLVDYVLMGTHFHLILRFLKFKTVSSRELKRRARMLHGDKKKYLWPRTPRQCKRFHKRLFSVSWFMADIEREMARRLNPLLKRRGPLFQRFESVVLEDLPSLLNCMLYIHLNPVRAHLVERPEQWPFSGYTARLEGRQEPLLSLQEVLPYSRDPEGEYRWRLYLRGRLDPRNQGGVIPEEIVASELKRGFKGGEYLVRQPAFSRSLGLGTREQVTRWVEEFREKRIYVRRINAIAHPLRWFYSIREQRGRHRLRPGPDGGSLCPA